MARGLKLTGFARFFFLLIILAPLAYLIASYANGQDGVGNLKKLIGLQDQPKGSADSSAPANLFVSKQEQIQQLQAQIQVLEDSLEAKNIEIEVLKQLLQNK